MKFIERRYDRAIRRVQRPEPVIERIDQKATALLPKIMDGRASPKASKARAAGKIESQYVREIIFTNLSMAFSDNMLSRCAI